MNRSDRIQHLRNIRDGFRALLRETRDESVTVECKRNLAEVERDLRELEAKN